jgi:hypothetical protein
MRSPDSIRISDNAIAPALTKLQLSDLTPNDFLILQEKGLQRVSP